MVCTKKRISQYKTSRQQSARSLNDLPMTFSKSDSSNMAEKCRTLRGELSDESQQAGRLSRRLMTDSKRLFNMAIIDASPPQPQRDPFTTTCRIEDDTSSLPPVHRELRFWNSRETIATRKQAHARDCYSSQSHRRHMTHTGPTQYGSLLYGSKTPLMTEPMRFECDPPPEYFRATPDIQKSLRESNRLYRTVTNEIILPLDESHTINDAITTRTGLSSARYLLVPTMNKPEVHRKAEGPELAPMRHVLATQQEDLFDIEAEGGEEEEIPVINVGQFENDNKEHDTIEERVDEGDIAKEISDNNPQPEVNAQNSPRNNELQTTVTRKKDSKSNQNSPRNDATAKATGVKLNVSGNGRQGVTKSPVG